MTHSHDLIVIGAGMAGVAAANKCAFCRLEGRDRRRAPLRASNMSSGRTASTLLRCAPLRYTQTGQRSRDGATSLWGPIWRR